MPSPASVAWCPPCPPATPGVAAVITNFMPHFGHALAGKHDEPARAVDVERVVHGVLGPLHLVDQPDLDPVAHGEGPGDGPVLVAGLAVDELPDHVGRVRLPVDLRHEVLPLDAVPYVGPMVCAVPPGRHIGEGGRDHQLHAALRARLGPGPGDLGVHGAGVGVLRWCGFANTLQLHPAPRAGCRLATGDVRVHRAGVGGRQRECLPVEQRHQGGEAEHLVGLASEVRGETFMLCGELRINA